MAVASGLDDAVTTQTGASATAGLSPMTGDSAISMGAQQRQSPGCTQQHVVRSEGEFPFDPDRATALPSANPRSRSHVHRPRPAFHRIATTIHRASPRRTAIRIDYVIA